MPGADEMVLSYMWMDIFYKLHFLISTFNTEQCYNISFINADIFSHWDGHREKELCFTSSFRYCDWRGLCLLHLVASKVNLGINIQPVRGEVKKAPILPEQYTCRAFPLPFHWSEPVTWLYQIQRQLGNVVPGWAATYLSLYTSEQKHQSLMDPWSSLPQCSLFKWISWGVELWYPPHLSMS